MRPFGPKRTAESTSSSIGGLGDVCPPDSSILPFFQSHRSIFPTTQSMLSQEGSSSHGPPKKKLSRQLRHLCIFLGKS
jgi:hypothetical protein